MWRDRVVGDSAGTRPLVGSENQLAPRRLKSISVFRPLLWLLAVGVVVAVCGAAPDDEVQRRALAAWQDDVR
jgi:hypothetical protein